jgi:hypothetical protein
MIMKLKLLIPSLVLLFAGTAASAQVSLAGQAGAVFSKAKTEEIGDITGLQYKEKSRVGFSAGLLADIPFGESGLRLMPELLYVQKGLKASGSLDFLGQSISAETNTNIAYLDLPVNLAYAFDLSSGRLFVGAGPYAGLGLNGRTKAKITAQGQTSEEDEDVDFGSGEEQVKRFDFGANVMAGYIMSNGLLIKVNYSHGFANLSNAPDGDWKNRYFGVSVGYFFLRGGE